MRAASGESGKNCGMALGHSTCFFGGSSRASMNDPRHSDISQRAGLDLILRCLVLLCALLFTRSGVAAEGDAAVEPDPPHWTIAHYIEQATQIPKTQRVRLRGTITAFWGPTAFFIQDGTEAIFVFLKVAPGTTRPGDAVEIIGLPVLGGRKPHLDVKTLRVLGAGGVLPPVDVGVVRALDGQLDATLVRIVGRIAEGKSPYGEKNSLLLVQDGVHFTAEFVNEEDGSAWPPNVRGEMVSVTGVCSVRGARDKAPVPLRILVRSRRDAVVVGPQPWWMPPRVYKFIALSAAVCLAGLSWALALHRQVRRQVRIKAEEIRARMQREITIEQRYRELWESATDVILTHDLEGRISAFNPAGERLLGWSAEEIVGRNISELLAPEEREIAGGILSPGTASRHTAGGPFFRLHLQTRDGHSLPFEINSWLEYQDGEPVGVQAICRDISERERVQEERARIERKLQESQKLESLGVLAGGVAHDFNNLLTAIIGNLNLARMDVGDATPIAESLDQAERAAERAADLCKQMLAFSGKGRFLLQPLGISALVRDTAELLRTSLSRKIEIDLQLAADLPAVLGDATQIRQIAMNLLINAGEAIGDAKGAISVETGVFKPAEKWFADAQVAPETPEEEYVFIEVRDTGCGMDAATLARVFEPFFTTKFTGRGLGLAAVLGILRGHRGALKVTSELGRGTTFRLLLPAAGPLPPAAETSASSAGTSLRRALVLVVDDEEVVRNTVHRLVESMGCDVVIATDGLDGVEKFRLLSDRIAAVVLDLTMPRMDGAEALHAMRAVRGDVRVVLMSGFAEAQAMARFAGAGVDGFLQKPFNAHDLCEKLRTVLGAHPTEESSPSVSTPAAAIAAQHPAATP